MSWTYLSTRFSPISVQIDALLKSYLNLTNWLLGWLQVMTSSDEEAPISRTEQAKQLLGKYGSAYLITSISFAIVSFAACYAAVSAGKGQGQLGAIMMAITIRRFLGCALLALAQLVFCGSVS
jgi:hypothetical protein